MNNAGEYLAHRLHHEIPLTRTMQLRVNRWENHELQLAAPLEPNINHAGSMFGGSLYSVAVLTGWGWLTLRLREAGIEGQIVIRGGSIEYPRPITGEAVGICTAPSEAEWEKFVRQYQRRGLARLQLDIHIHTPSGETAVHLRGDYVLQR